MKAAAFAILLALLPVAFFAGCGGDGDKDVLRDPLDLGGFCGLSTSAECSADKHCVGGGCSGQLCQHFSELLSTTCEWLDCYRDEDFGVACGCVANECRWYSEVKGSN